MAHRSNDRLTAFINIDVPHDHRLANLSAVAVQSLHLRREKTGDSELRRVGERKLFSYCSV